MTRIELLRQIVSECQAQKITMQDDHGKSRKIYVDMTTANVVVSVHDALNEQNRAKFIALPWAKMARVAWKLAA